MNKNITKELNEIKFLFKYKPGVVLSEQVEDTEVSFEMSEEEEFDVPVMLPGTKEKGPKTPYSPKPGPKPDPKAGRDGDIPDWLSFDELGIDFE
jgi:hypothetical protein